MEQFDILRVMTSEQQESSNNYSVITNNTTTATSFTANNLHQLDDAIAVIRDIAAAEGQPGLLPEEQAFVPAGLMAAEEDNDNTNDYSTSNYSSQVAAVDTSCSYAVVHEYLAKPVELDSAQPGTSQQFLSATSITPYWGEGPTVWKLIQIVILQAATQLPLRLILFPIRHHTMGDQPRCPQTSLLE